MKKAKALVVGAVKRFLDARCSLHAAGLTYFALLSFMPVLCLSLLLAKVCGVGDVARDQINTRLDAYITQIETAHDDPSVVAHMPPEKLKEKKEAAKAIASQARSLEPTVRPGGPV